MVTGSSKRALFAALFLVASLLVFNANLAFASMETLVDGVEAFEEQKYGEAEAFFQKALAEEPDNSEILYYLALVYSKTGRSDKAVETLSDLLSKHPEEYRKAYFDIAAIHSAQNRHQKALDVLKEAMAAKPDDARPYLEAAVVAKNMGDTDQALMYAKKAGEIDPAAKGSSESLIASIYFEQEDYEAAEALLTQIAAQNAQSPLGESARASLKAVALARKSKRPWFANTSFTIGYDDNVINKPLDPQAGIYPEDKDDWFETLTATAGFTAYNKKGVRSGFGLSMNVLGYHDMPQNNILAYNPFLFFESHKAKTHLRLRYDFNYYLTGGESQSIHDYGWLLTFDSSDDRLSTHRIMPALAIEEPHGLMTDVALAWMAKDYFGVTADADAAQFFLTQTWRPDQNKSLTFRASYSYYMEDSEQKENSYNYHQIGLGAFTGLAMGFGLDASYAFTRTAYDDNPMIWTGSRKDGSHRLTLAVNRRFFDFVDASLSYTYNQNGSNVINLATGGDDYEYRKNMLSLTLSAAF